MTPLELLIALPAARWIAGVCLTIGTVCGAGAVLALFWRWPAHGPEARRLRQQRDDAWEQVRDLLEQNKRMVALYAEAKSRCVCGATVGRWVGGERGGKLARLKGNAQ